ncbi:hypothetical protein MSAN_01683900 [Mycena sanguinolenta]|uniref:DUF6534 domain-containing protein n=1 Tax=Mycena sanguinolenta TaxID=230812 RepID=A0A8H7CVJ7_9AGAR|nr:hypothetical protein MSAN_01683900 [Mycena sanguinolenta]
MPATVERRTEAFSAHSWLQTWRSLARKSCIGGTYSMPSQSLCPNCLRVNNKLNSAKSFFIPPRAAMSLPPSPSGAFPSGAFPSGALPPFPSGAPFPGGPPQPLVPVGTTGSIVSLVSSTWLNTALYAIELVLAAYYLRRPRSRSLSNKLCVFSLLFFDTLATAGSFVNVIMALGGIVTFDLRSILAPTAVGILTTFATAAITQTFLCYMFYRLTNNKLISSIIILMILAHLGVTWASGILVLTTLNVGGAAFTTTKVGAILCAATDIIIAGLLSWNFWRMMALIPPERSTRSLLRKILLIVISSGTIVAANTILMLILLVKHSLAFFFFFTSQGRVYSLTILGNFLIAIPTRMHAEMRVATPNKAFDTAMPQSAVVFHVEGQSGSGDTGDVESTKGGGTVHVARVSLMNRRNTNVDEVELRPMDHGHDYDNDISFDGNSHKEEK